LLSAHLSGAGPPHQFATAIRTNLLHLLRASVAEGALVNTNVRRLARCDWFPALLANSSHFQCQNSFLSLRCPRESLSSPLRPNTAIFMHKGNSIIMRAPRQTIFETAANLELWPKILPHYRYIRYLERSPERNLVVMAANRSGIPISWTSEQLIDREQLEVRFHHLKAWTKGMRVVWTFKETPAGVLVEILHDLRFRVPLLAPIMEPIVGDFFIHHIANKTLRCMKSYLERPNQ
jgi:ribosome-associated toxin RatA of RatAB toxin-antitoxin module